MAQQSPPCLRVHKSMVHGRGLASAWLSFSDIHCQGELAEYIGLAMALVTTMEGREDGCNVACFVFLHPKGLSELQKTRRASCKEIKLTWPVRLSGLYSDKFCFASLPSLIYRQSSQAAPPHIGSRSCINSLATLSGDILKQNRSAG